MEFPGKMLKFYDGEALIQAIYIKDEKITFVKSFAEEYKKLKFSFIKEDLEDLNEKLQIEGKEKIQIEFKDG